MDPRKLLHYLLATTICQTARCYECKKCIECIPSNMTTKERQDKEKKEENFTLRHHINIVNGAENKKIIAFTLPIDKERAKNDPRYYELQTITE